MKKEEFDSIIKEKIKLNNLNVELNEKQIEYLFNYMKNIIEWNEKINVTAIENEEMFIVKHYLDSFTIKEFIKGSDRILDIGTGAGFPGIPIKICYPNSNITLIDSVNKKLNVIKDSIKSFNFNNIEIIHTRAEDLAKNKNYRESFDVVTTRAVSNLTTICEYMIPFLKKGGIAICMKGPNIDEEIKNSQNAIDILGGKIESIVSFNIDKELERNIIIIKKIKNTPNQYPRGGGKPLKEPIK